MKRICLILIAVAMALATRCAVAQMPVPHELLGHKRSTFKVPRARAWDEENYKYFGGGPDVENECGGVGHCFHRPAVWSCPHYIVPPYQASWIIRNELLGISRGKEEPQNILFRTTDNAPLFSMDDFDFDHELGYRLSAQKNITEYVGLEAVYLRLHQDWEEDLRIDDVAPIELRAAGIVINSPVAPFDVAYLTKFQGAEVNMRYYVNNFSASYIAGFRWVEIDELFRAGAVGAPPPLLVETTNRLFGGQIGIESQHWVNYGILRIDSTLKGGIYQNMSSQISRLDPAVATASGNDIAWVGEAVLAVNFPLTKHAYLRASYRALHIAGLAIAADQINSTDLSVPVAALNSEGNALYHGGSLGLEFWW